MTIKLFFCLEMLHYDGRRSTVEEDMLQLKKEIKV